MQFEVTPLGFSAKTRVRPLVLLTGPRKFDDYGYSTGFDVRLLLANKRVVNLGWTKILQRGNCTTSLPNHFGALDSTYCSLGQDQSYYDAISKLPGNLGAEILKGLRDIVFDRAFAQGHQADPGFEKSLARFSSARELLEHGAAALAPERSVAERDISFKLLTKLAGFATECELSVQFSRTRLGRIVTLVGRNGVGKTRLLAELAAVLSGYGSKNTTTRLDRRPALPRVLSLSFSAFDQFIRPADRGHRASYQYWGLRDRQDKVSLEHLRSQVERALVNLRGPARRVIFRNAVERSGLLQFEPFIVKLLSGRAQARCHLSDMSAGHQLAFMAICALVSGLNRNTIVLFDEPETHLHPTLLSAVMRVLHFLLEHYDAFAIVATHSPVPLQETPGRNVRIMNLMEDNIPTITRYPGECFGENLGEIVWKAFGPTPEDTNYMRLLQSLRQEGQIASLRQVVDRPPLSVRMALRTIGKGSP